MRGTRRLPSHERRFRGHLSSMRVYPANHFTSEERTMSHHDSHATGGGGDYQHFRGLLDELEQHSERHRALTAAAPGGDPIQQICQFWPVLRTVLQIVLALPFIPPNVKKTIQQAIELFNRICGGAAAPAGAGGGGR
jgi:hypothetical protein